MTPHDPVGPDWRATRSAAGGSGRKVLPAILALAVLAAVALAVLVWVQPARPPVLLAVNTSSAAFAVADLRRVSSLPSRSPPVSLVAEPDRDQLRTAVAALRKSPARSPVVVYLGGAAEVDAAGHLILAPTVAGADHDRNRWPFAELLQSLAECPASGKFLVLNLSASAEDWVTPAVRALESVPDTGRTVLFAHGIDEVSHAGLEWDGSAFAGYFAEGFRGAADGWNESGTLDGRVSVNELSAFVRARVSRWAERNRAIPQTPWQTGEGTDFELGSVTEPEPVTAVTLAYPPLLRDAWAVRDGWLADGRSTANPTGFLALERALLSMDRQWFDGATPDAARATFDATATQTRPPPARVPPVLKELPAADPAQFQEVSRYVARADSPPDPAEKPPAATPSAVFAVAVSDVAWTPAKWKRLAELLAVIEPEPSSFPSLLIRRIGTTEEPVSAVLAGRLVRAATEFEATSRDDEFFPWGQLALADAEARWRTAVAYTFAPKHVAAADADRAVAELEDAVRSLAFARGRFGRAVAELHAADRVPAAGPLTAARQRLRAALVPHGEPPAAAANTWATLTAEVAAARLLAGEVVRPAALARLRQRATSGTDGPATLEDFDRLLASPLFPAPDRSAVWTDRLALAAKLHDDVRARDRREDDGIRAGLTPAPWRDPTERPPSLPSRSGPVFPPLALEIPPPPREFLNWHAGRFDDWTSDPLDLPAFAPDAEFAAKAAEVCRAFGAAPAPRSRIEWAVAPASVELTPGVRVVSADVRIRLLGSENPLMARLAVLSPTPEWVTGRISADIQLSPIRSVSTPLTVSVGSAPQKWGRLSGVLLSAAVAGRPSFKRLPVNTDRLSNRLELLVKAAADGPELPATILRLRPNGRPSSFTFALANPTAVAQTVAVRLADPPRQIASVTVPPGKSVPLVFPPPPAANPPPADPSPATPISAPAVFRFQLLDPKTFAELQAFNVPVTLLEPTESVTVREVVFRPGGDGKPGELSAVLTERESFRGGPMPLAMALPADRNPGVVVPDGKLSGTLDSGGLPVRLYATNPTFDRGKGGTVTLTVAADGVERAFVFRGDIGNDGGVTRFNPLLVPRVAIVAADLATGLEPLPVTFETENAPPTATLEVDIGTGSGPDFRRDYQLDVNPPARRRATTLVLDPKGAFALSAAITDTGVSLPVGRLVGARLIRARMLDATGKEIARATRRVVFDGAAPRNVRFLDPPARAKAAAPLAVRVTVDPPVSGVKEVTVFLGKPANNAPPPTATRIPAKPDGDGWTATVPLGAGPVPADISAQVVSGSGQSGFATITIVLVPAAEFDKPKPGTISGTVVEGTVDQPGLTVRLFDEKGQEKAKAKTADDGTFAFPDLPPGKYRVFAAKVTTGREKGVDLEVKAGETTAVTLSLVLK